MASVPGDVFRGALRALLLLMLLPLVGSSAVQKTEQADEYKLKAAFLYNFTRFTEWPSKSFEEKDSPLTIAIIGTDPFGGTLKKAFAGKKVGERKVVVKNFKTPEDIEHCHVLFVPRTESGKLAEITKKLKDKSVLLVGESRDFAVHGGVLNFYVSKSKLCFEANPTEAESRKLKISSRLLKLARIVKPEELDEEEEAR